MEPYKEMRIRHQEEINRFPLGAAFTNKQFGEMMKKFGLTTDAADQICNLGSGLFCKKNDLKKFKTTMRRQKTEVRNAMVDKSYGEEFAYHAFLYEFNNHGCGYTGDFELGIAARRFTYEEIEKNRRLKKAYDKAVKKAIDCVC